MILGLETERGLFRRCTTPASGLELSDLVESNEVLFTGPYPRETALVHRIIFNEHYETAF